MTGTTSTKLATFEEFEGIEFLSADLADQVSGGVSVPTAAGAVKIGLGGGFLAFQVAFGVGGIMVAMATLFHHLGWTDEVENANGEGSTIRKVTSGGGNSAFGGSDIRLKQDIRCEGAIDTLGVKVYSWEYKDYPGERFVGLMAQDLLARSDLAHAVSTFDEGPFAGFYGVNYGALGMTMLPEEAWDGDVRSLMLNQSVSA